MCVIYAKVLDVYFSKLFIYIYLCYTMTQTTQTLIIYVQNAYRSKNIQAGVYGPKSICIPHPVYKITPIHPNKPHLGWYFYRHISRILPSIRRRIRSKLQPGWLRDHTWGLTGSRIHGQQFFYLTLFVRIKL